MKKLKGLKSQAVLEFIYTYGWAFLVILVAVGALAYFGVLTPDKFVPDNFYCQNNPDKCVCEKITCCVKGYSSWYESSECKDESKNYANSCKSSQETFGGCLKFRLKTQAELDIDDCNSNPRKDELCRCEKTKDMVKRGYVCPNNSSCREITIKECKIKGLYYYNQEIEYEGRIIFDDQCELNSLFPDIRVTDAKNVTMQVIERNITNCEQCYEYEQVCLKSRPKTECEKGNPDWVEEKKLQCHFFGKSQGENIDFSIDVINNTCRQKLGDFFPKGESFQPNSEEIIDAEIINQTICREKTDVEKLMDKDCKQIVDELDEIRRNNFPSKAKAEKLKPYLDVIRIKECQMLNKIFVVED